MALYPYTLFLHILGVLGLFIAIALELMTVIRLRAAKTIAQVRDWMPINSLLEKLFPISSLLILVAGLYMTFTVWGWSHAWIDVSLVALVVLGALGPMVNGRRLKAIDVAIEAAPDGPLPALIEKLIHDPVLLTFGQVTGFTGIGIVCLMTIKPDWIGSLAVMVVSVVVGIVSGRLSQGTARTTQPAAQSSHAEAALEETPVK